MFRSQDILIFVFLLNRIFKIYDVIIVIIEYW